MQQPSRRYRAARVSKRSYVLFPVIAALAAFVAPVLAETVADEGHLRLYHTHTGQHLDVITGAVPATLRRRYRNWTRSCAIIAPVMFTTTTPGYLIYFPT